MCVKERQESPDRQRTTQRVSLAREPSLKHVREGGREGVSACVRVCVVREQVSSQCASETSLRVSD